MPAPTDTAPLANGNVADASQVEAKFDLIFSYLQSGVDTIADGSVVAADLATSLNAFLGVTASGTTRRGAVSIATQESRANVAFGTLPTPDRVQSVVLPTNGLIAVAYQATWRESVVNSGKASIFIGANQLRAAFTNASQAQQTEAFPAGTGAANVWQPLASSPVGLLSQGQAGAVDYSVGDAITGQVVGRVGNLNATDTPLTYIAGPCFIFANAGTYDVSVQYRATAGQVDVKNRKLWVWTMGF